MLSMCGAISVFCMCVCPLLLLGTHDHISHGHDETTLTWLRLWPNSAQEPNLAKILQLFSPVAGNLRAALFSRDGVGFAHRRGDSQGGPTGWHGGHTRLYAHSSNDDHRPRFQDESAARGHHHSRGASQCGHSRSRSPMSIFCHISRAVTCFARCLLSPPPPLPPSTPASIEP